jgi:hypothetical protein
LILDVQAIVNLLWLLYCLDFVDLLLNIVAPLWLLYCLDFVDLLLTIVAPLWFLLDAFLALVDMLKLLFMI